MKLKYIKLFILKLWNSEFGSDYQETLYVNIKSKK